MYNANDMPSQVARICSPAPRRNYGSQYGVYRYSRRSRPVSGDKLPVALHVGSSKVGKEGFKAITLLAPMYVIG